MKTCSRCKKEKDLDCFGKRSNRKTGYFTICKQCKNEERKQKRKEDPEYFNAPRRIWAEDNKEKLKEINDRYVQNNREKVNESHRRWYKETGQKRVYTERLKEWTKEYREKNKEIVRIRGRATTAVWKALEKGELIKPKKCEGCGKERKLEGHHKDYTKPLEVIWVCRWCHAEIHRTEEVIYGNQRDKTVNE